MENLLFINACVRGERSRTLKLARRFLEAYRAGHPDTVITERDLCATGSSHSTRRCWPSGNALLECGQAGAAHV